MRILGWFLACLGLFVLALPWIIVTVLVFWTGEPATNYAVIQPVWVRILAVIALVGGVWLARRRA